MVAIRAGDTEALATQLEREPSLATSRSSCSHPTLMQCLVLDGKEHDPKTQLAMARLLRAAGSEVDGPLLASASVANSVLASYLLDEGAAIDGRDELLGGWSPLEEALYWGHEEMASWLLRRGASVGTLRAAAALGRVDIMEACLGAEGVIDVERAGAINSPFMESYPEQRSNESQDVLDNALIYAAAAGQLGAVDWLVAQGARVDSIPPGFDFLGTPLHNAAIRGRRSMCEHLLELGADPNRRDEKVQQTPAGWARHGGHDDLATWLEDFRR